MADHRISKQNFDENIIQKPHIQCKRHLDSFCDAMKLNISEERVLVCMDCCIQDELDCKQLVSFNKIFSSKRNEIINNWPPYVDSQFYSELSSIVGEDTLIQDRMNTLKCYFDTLRNEIIEILEKKQKQLIVHITAVEEQRQNVIQQYNQQIDRQDMQNYFFDNQADTDNVESYAKTKIKQLLENNKDNQYNLRNSLTNLSIQDQKYNQNYLDDFSSQMINIFQRIDFLNPLINIKDDILCNAQSQQQQNNGNNQQNIDVLIELINNKSNFCNQVFIENLKQILTRNSSIFSQLDFSQAIQQNKEPLKFDSIDLQQFEYVKFITSKNDELNHLQLNPSNERSYLEQNYFLMKSLLMKSESKLQKRIEKFSRKNKEQILDKLNKKCSLESIEVIQTKYEFSENVTIRRCLEIENDSSLDQCRQVFIDREITARDKFFIQVELLSQSTNNDDILLGLLPFSKRDESAWKFELSLYTQDVEWGVQSVVKGKHISEMRKDVSLITFHICLKEKIFQCAYTVNNVQNVIQLSDWNHLKPNEQYHFYIAMFHSYQKVLIKQFKKVPFFEEF